MNLQDYIKNIVKDCLNENYEKDILKKLERENKYTLPKIPTKNVFFNDVANISSIRKKADEYIDKGIFEELPVEYVNIQYIVPTQKNITINNLKSTKNISDNTEAYLVKYKGYYYILDGHHRIANRILRGDNKIKAYVFNQE